MMAYSFFLQKRRRISRTGLKLGVCLNTVYCSLNTAMSQHKPLIGIPADRKLLGHHYFHCVGEKYLKAVIDGANAVPVVIPSLGSMAQLDSLIAQLDGVLLPGSPSHV